jgi:hypothetical protein
MMDGYSVLWNVRNFDLLSMGSEKEKGKSEKAERRKGITAKTAKKCKGKALIKESSRPLRLKP